jgi:hypothetical protein
MRELHRDIGYFAVGISLLYALSGFLLSHKHVFPSTRITTTECSLTAGMNAQRLGEIMERQEAIQITYSRPDGELIRFFFEGGEGYYSIASGEVHYETLSRRDIVLFVNQLHLNQRNGWVAVADIYSFLLAFLALSGLVMVKGRAGFWKRGIWFMLPGFILVLVFIWVR